MVKENPRNRAVLYIMTFIMGGCGIAYEYTYSKISSDLMGNSVQQWAVTIGLMMFFMGIGSDLQKHLKDEGLFDKFVIFELMLGMMGGFGPILMLWLFSASREHYVLVQYTMIISTGFLIGLEIPILARINERYTEELKVNLGGILRMDYIGAFAGAVLWTFIFLKFFGLTQIGFVLGIFNLVCAALALFYFWKIAARPVMLTWVTLACVLSLTYGLSQVKSWTRHSEQALFLDPIIFSTTTKYQHIVLTRSPSGEIFCYINGNTQFSSWDEYIYHEMLVHPAMAVAESRKKVLVLGGGDGLAVREILKYPDVEEITLVDLDPAMTDLAQNNEFLRALNKGSLVDAKVKILENHALIDAPEVDVRVPDRTGFFEQDRETMAQVSLINVDAVKFIDQAAGFYDVIIIDFPDPSNLELAKLYSRTFYAKLRNKLAKHGIMVQQSTSPIHSKQAFLCIGRTMENAGYAVVPFHENVPVFGDWGFWIAGKQEAWTDVQLKNALDNVAGIPENVRHVSPELIHASLVFGKESLKTEQTTINTILNNAIFFYYQAEVF